MSYSKQMRANLISSKPSLCVVHVCVVVWAQIDSLNELMDDAGEEVRMD